VSVEPGDRRTDRRPEGDPRSQRDGAAGVGIRKAAADFRIGDVLVQPSLQRVVAAGAVSILEPKLMKVLVLLASRPGEVVTKEELFADVWEGAFVTEDVLTRAIGELRRTFGDDAARPRVIETIRKTGYRLIAPVVAAGTPASASVPPFPSPSSSASALSSPLWTTG